MSSPATFPNSAARKSATTSSSASSGAETQVAYAKVTLNIVDSLTSEVVFLGPRCRRV